MKANLKTFVATGLAVSLLGTGGTLALAAGTSKPVLPAATAGTLAAPEFGGRMIKTQSFDFSNLVTQGVIDQATADKIKAYQEQKMTAMQTDKDGVKRGEKMDMFAEMVTDGVITQAQADAIKAAMPQPTFSDGGRKAGHFDFSNLVTQGVIDQTTADKIKAYQEQKMAAMQTEMGKLATMTEEEKKTLLESGKDGVKRGEKIDMFAEMVTDGVITQAQADAIKAAMPQPSENFQSKDGKVLTGTPPAMPKTNAVKLNQPK